LDCGESEDGGGCRLSHTSGVCAEERGSQHPRSLLVWEHKANRGVGKYPSISSQYTDPGSIVDIMAVTVVERLRWEPDDPFDMAVSAEFTLKRQAISLRFRAM
jgi:hypothetical protein